MFWFFHEEKLYKCTKWEWLSYKVTKRVHVDFFFIIVTSTKEFRWVSASLWTRIIKIYALLSLSQYVIKDRFIFFQLVTFLSPVKVIWVIIQLKVVPLKNILSPECKLSITLNRITILETIGMWKSEWPGLSYK